MSKTEGLVYLFIYFRKEGWMIYRLVDEIGILAIWNNIICKVRLSK